MPPKEIVKEGEVFKLIPSTAQRYSVSNYGRVFSLPYGRIIPLHNNAIVCQTLRDDKIKQVKHNITKLVLRLFRPDALPTKHVKHINGKRDDNRAENLAWSTIPEIY